MEPLFYEQVKIRSLHERCNYYDLEQWPSHELVYENESKGDEQYPPIALGEIVNFQAILFSVINSFAYKRQFIGACAIDWQNAAGDQVEHIVRFDMRANYDGEECQTDAAEKQHMIDTYFPSVEGIGYAKTQRLNLKAGYGSLIVSIVSIAGNCDEVALKNSLFDDEEIVSEMMNMFVNYLIRTGHDYNRDWHKE